VSFLWRTSVGITNGTTPLNEFADNDEGAYAVTVGGSYRDITAGTSRRQAVSKREVREMFTKFLRASPELLEFSRDEQIRQFNLERQEIKRPKIDEEILRDLLVPLE
jgi:hypothetical protein